MNLNIHGKQVDIGTALREQTEDKFESLVEKHFPSGWSGTVTFSKEAGSFRCDGHIHLFSGMSLQASAVADSAYTALEGASNRLEKRLRRYMRRLKDHHAAQETPIETYAAPAYVIEPSADSDEVTEPETLEPVIIAEMSADVKSLTVGEAVMQLDLQDTPAILFQNRGTGRLNMVYRRNDGNIGWIDPPAGRAE